MGSYLEGIGRYPLLTAEQERCFGLQVQSMMVLVEAKATLKKALGVEPTTTEISIFAGVEEGQIEEVFKKGRQAKRRMLESNLRLVVKIAKMYHQQSSKIDLIDLVQEGALGLNRGIEKFDPSKGCKFSTYAFWWIRQAITRAIAEQSRTIRLPIYLTERRLKIRKAEARLRKALGYMPSDEEIAKEMGESVQKIKQTQCLFRSTASLNTLVGVEKDAELGDLIADGGGIKPDVFATSNELKEKVMGFVDTLPPAEKKMIELRYGLGSCCPMTLQAIGDKLGISRERARQLEVKALNRLRASPSIRYEESLRDYLI